MDLQELLGDDYKEGITSEEVENIFSQRLLKTGKYVSKEKADAEKKANTAKYNELNQKFTAKLSDEEIAENERAELQKALDEAKETIKQNNIAISRAAAEAGLAETKTLLGIKDDDTEYAEFLSNIANEDSDKVKKTSSYMAKILKQAYEKGKGEKDKQDLGNMGNMVMGADGKMVDKDKAFVQSIMAGRQPSTNTENSNFF